MNRDIINTSGREDANASADDSLLNSSYAKMNPICFHPGQLYQIKVISIFAEKAIKLNGDFKLFTLMKSAEGFHTVKFTSSTRQIYVQGRHKQNGSEITENQLWSAKNDYGLKNLFDAFSSIDDAGIFLFCTNRPMAKRTLGSNFEAADRVEIEDFFGDKGTYCRLKNNRFDYFKETFEVSQEDEIQYLRKFSENFRLLIRLTDEELDKMHSFQKPTQWKAFQFDIWKWYGSRTDDKDLCGEHLSRANVQKYVSDIFADWRSENVETLTTNFNALSIDDDKSETVEAVSEKHIGKENYFQRFFRRFFRTETL